MWRLLSEWWERWRRRAGPLLTEKVRIGYLGETAAAALLQEKKGMKLLCRNWRHGRDELDLILQDGQVLVFVEVRSRSETAVVSGYHSVRRRKKAALLRVCKAYLRSLPQRTAHFRFDIVEVRLGNGAVTTIHHYENVPLFPKGYR